jgi:hypothetical protein
VALVSFARRVPDTKLRSLQDIERDRGAPERGARHCTSHGISWRPLVTARGPVARILIGLGLLCGLVLALLSSVVLHGASLLFVVAVAGLVAWAASRTVDDRRAARAAAWQAAGSTVALSMLVAGAVVLGGAAAGVLVSGLALAAGGAVWLRHVRRARLAGRAGRDRPPARDDAPPAPAPVSLAGWLDGSPSPVSLMPFPTLGSEWVRTTAALASRLEPAARFAVVRRRHEVLDELERRDPAGFASWLAAGTAMNGDPAGFLGSGRATGTDAA